MILSVFRSVLLSLCVVLIFSGCDTFKNMKEMHDSTQEVKETSKRLEALTRAMFGGLRKGDMKQLRKSCIDEMDEETELLPKIAAAAAYYQAFEYQLWYYLSDSVALRDKLEEAAASEFLRKTFGHIPEVKSEISAFSINPWLRNKTWNTGALALTMHYKNDLQESFFVEMETGKYQPTAGFNYDPAQGKDLKVESMLSILKNALTANVPVDQGKAPLKSLTASQKAAANFAQYIVYFLQVRHNFLDVLTFGRLTGLADAGGNNFITSNWNKFWTKWDATGGFRSKSDWSPRWEEWNLVQLDEMRRYQEEALETRKFLKSLNIPIMEDGDIRRMRDHMQQGNFMNAAFDELIPPRRELISQIYNYLQPSN